MTNNLLQKCIFVCILKIDLTKHHYATKIHCVLNKEKLLIMNVSKNYMNICQTVLNFMLIKHKEFILGETVLQIFNLLTLLLILNQEKNVNTCKFCIYLP